MSKKRTNTDVDEQKNGDSDLFPQEDDVKRARISSWSDTTLEDLPLELIESILIKAIVMEVKELKLANSVWKEKADLVISRLCTVCSHWSNILTTNFFRNELHRSLNAAQETIRLEIVQQTQIHFDWVCIVAAMKDEIFLMVRSPLHGLCIDVYDRNNMAVVTDVIPLTGISPHTTVACNVSNCLYMLKRELEIGHGHFSVLRIARGSDNRFTIEQLISNLYLGLPQPCAGMCVTPNGNLILLREPTIGIDAITVCDANGNVQHTVRLPMDVNRYDGIMAKSNGNLVLVQVNDQSERKLVEISMNVDIIRQYQSSLDIFVIICDADNKGRMLVCDINDKLQLLDSEYNIMEFSSPQLPDGHFTIIYELHYNSDRNEVVVMTAEKHSQNRLLTVLHL